MDQDKLDPRLKNVENSVYRMWHDNHNISIPKGESTTQPLDREIVGVNVRTFGEVKKGKFFRPVVEFRNTYPSQELFDRFNLDFSKDPDDLNFEDLDNINSLTFELEFIIEGIFEDITLEGVYHSAVTLNKLSSSLWKSENHVFTNKNSIGNPIATKFIDGSFNVSTIGLPYFIPQVLLPEYDIEGRPLYINLLDINYHVGNSIYPLTGRDPLTAMISFNTVKFKLLRGGS